MSRRLVAALALTGALALVGCGTASMESTPLPPGQSDSGSQTSGTSQAPSSNDQASDDQSSDDSSSDAAPVSGADGSSTAPSSKPKAGVATPSAKVSSASKSVAAAERFVCRHPAQPGARECDAIVRPVSRASALDPPGSACSKTAPYCASDLQAAYNVTQIAKTRGRGVTVAVVDAYGYPGAAGDLAIYRKNMGLPACTPSAGCLRIVNQSAQSSPLPALNSDDDWQPQEALDLDMISAICPNCKILLVQTNSNKDSDLDAGVNAAIALGASAVSSSYSGRERNAADSAYNHPSRILTASAGNDGPGVAQPCSYGSVVCVGGTSLRAASSHRGWSERTWIESGSGCSAYVPRPRWQHVKSCKMRTVSDVSAVADPDTGVLFYQSPAGWQQAGGTGVSSPIVAAVLALSTNDVRANASRWIWTHGKKLPGGGGL
jgi:subtilase family serine protease